MVPERAKAQPTPRVASLQRLARIWRARRTGQLRGEGKAIDLIDGELRSAGDRAELLRALAAPKLLWRDRELEGAGVPLIGALLLGQARRLADPSTVRGNLVFEDTDRMELPPALQDFIFSGASLQELIRRPAAEREALRKDLAALLLLKLASSGEGLDERTERRWLKAQIKRIEGARSPSSLLDLPPQSSPELLRRAGQAILDRATPLQSDSNARVREAASRVCAQVLLTLRGL